MTIPLRPAPPLPFDADRRPGSGRVGSVHSDGSITYLGIRYATLRDLPASCVAFRADLKATLQWRRLYRAVAPARRSRT